MEQDKTSKSKIKTIVIGGGPAGVQVALSAHELGAE